MKRAVFVLLASVARSVHAAPLSAPCLENAVTPNAACNPVNTANPMPVVQGSIAAGSGTAGYPPGSTPVNGQQTGANTTSNGVSLVAPVGQFAYICGFNINGLGTTSTTPANVIPTISNLNSGGTLSFTYTYPVGATVPSTPLSQTFSPCLKGSATGTNINLNVGGATGNTSTNELVWGYTQ